MNGILLAVPALLPIVGGTAILASGYGAEDDSTYRHLEIVVEGLVLLNSLLVALLIAGRSGMDNGLVLFKLYGNLTVRFKLDRMGSVFAARTHGFLCHGMEHQREGDQRQQLIKQIHGD